MRGDLLILALMVGAANWVFRAGPMLWPLPGMGGSGPLARFLGATGAAAIATLFVASVLPELQTRGLDLPLIAGVAAVCGLWWARKSVALATVAGAVAYGAVTALWG